MSRIDRIVVDPQILVGKPVIKGTRISVEQILRSIAGGMSHAEILDAYPRLTEDDILAAVEYAADTIANEVVEIV